MKVSDLWVLDYCVPATSTVDLSDPSDEEPKHLGWGDAAMSSPISDVLNMQRQYFFNTANGMHAAAEEFQKYVTSYRERVGKEMSTLKNKFSAQEYLRIIRSANPSYSFLDEAFEESELPVEHVVGYRGEILPKKINSGPPWNPHAKRGKG